MTAESRSSSRTPTEAFTGETPRQKELRCAAEDRLAGRQDHDPETGEVRE